MLEHQERERLNMVQIVLREKVLGIGPFKKIKQEQSATPAIRWQMLVFYKSAIEQARRTAVPSCNDPGTTGFGISGEK
jgi:hypothetical protein